MKTQVWTIKDKQQLEKILKNVDNYISKLELDENKKTFFKNQLLDNLNNIKIHIESNNVKKLNFNREIEVNNSKVVIKLRYGSKSFFDKLKKILGM